jgi:hypothetical protein
MVLTIRLTVERLCTIEEVDKLYHQTKMQNYREKIRYQRCERAQAIRRIQEFGDEGRALWKQEVGCHRRSRVETLMFRYNTILGERITARRGWTQATEISIKLDVLNRMTELGMPKSYKLID